MQAEEGSMFNVVTLVREYGSEGTDIGRKVAELLGRVCADKQIIERAAAMGEVGTAWAEKADEHANAWWERVIKGFRHGGVESYIGAAADSVVDHDTLQQFTASVIQEAVKVGRCVIIGRSSQCVLHHVPYVLRVLVYAPQAEKIKRMKLRHSHEHDLPALLHRMDSERAHYAQNYYGCASLDRRPYHLWLNSTLGIDACSELMVQAVQRSHEGQSLRLEGIGLGSSAL